MEATYQLTTGDQREGAAIALELHYDQLCDARGLGPGSSDGKQDPGCDDSHMEAISSLIDAVRGNDAQPVASLTSADAELIRHCIKRTDVGEIARPGYPRAYTERSEIETLLG